MTAKRKVIDESQLPPDQLEPSTEFAQLVKRAGASADVGTFGLGAIRQLVRERAGVERPRTASRRKQSPTETPTGTDED